MVASEIVGIQDEKDTASGLTADLRHLLGLGGARQKQARFPRARRRDQNPSLGVSRRIGSQVGVLD